MKSLMGLNPVDLVSSQDTEKKEAEEGPCEDIGRRWHLPAKERGIRKKVTHLPLDLQLLATRIMRK